jgi:hypothetical protein
MTVYMEALVDFADVKKGDTFYAFTIPNDPIDEFKGMEGKLFYATDKAPHKDETFILEETMCKRVFISIEDCMAHSVKYECSGVQDEEDFFSAVGLNSWDFDWSTVHNFEERTKCEYFDRWLCTDTHVGKGVLSIDGERVALFSQTGRKNGCNFKWLSKEAKDKARKFAQEFIKQDGFEYNDVLEEGENLVDFFM